MNAETKNLIKIIKLAPLFMILFSFFILLAWMYKTLEKDLENEKLFTQTQYIENEKDRIHETINTMHNYIKNEKLISK